MIAVLLVGAPAVAGPVPSVAIGDVTIAEGNTGTTNAVFTIQASPPPKSCCNLQVSWATAAGTATAGTDFLSSSGTVTLSKTYPSRTVSVPVVGDTFDEADETFFVNLSTLVGSPGTIGDAQALGTITDDDATPALSVNDVSVGEGNSGPTTATFTISLSAASGRSVGVNWTTTAGTATAGADYVAASGSRTIAAGATTATVGITVNGDTLNEDDETFGIALSSPTNATIADGSGVGTIVDDDSIPTLSVNDVNVGEGDTGTTTATFTISLSAASGRSVGVNWATTGGTATAGADYVAASGSRTIAAGATTATVGITVNGDTLDEDDETFGIALSSPTNATIADGSGVGTILDDDPRPSLSIADSSIAEGDSGTTTMTFAVTLSAASGRTVTVQWATANDDAVSPSDYAAASGTLTFSPGQTSKSISVTVNGDVVAELDEPFFVNLSGQTNATITDGQATGTILDDELLPVIDLAPASAPEGDVGTTTMTFDVSLSNPSSQSVTVDWVTEAMTATADVDYLSDGGTVVFPALETSRTIEVTVIGDTRFEAAELFAVKLSNPTNAPLGHASRTGTIVNDDPSPSLSVADASVEEGDAGTTVLSFVVTSSAVSGLNASASYATSNGTATAGSDYEAATGTVTIPAGSTSRVIDVTVDGDARYEPDETLTLTLSTPVNATIGDGTAQGTILDDDPAPTTITVNRVVGATTVKAKGILEPTEAGHRVTVTLFHREGGRFVKIAAATVSVKGIRDRDGDGKPDGTYTAAFTRPAAGGRYKLTARFLGDDGYKPCSKKKTFRLTRR